MAEPILVDTKAMAHYHQRIEDKLNSGGTGGTNLKPLPADEFYEIWNR